jgi:hypothetical protein
MFTRTELEELRASVAASPAMLADRPDVMETLLAQAEYALDCAALLDEAVHFPAEPYSDAEALVARLTDGVNDIWNRRK